MADPADPGTANRTESLIPEQQRAIDSEAPLICVRAGPGSGKTRVLVRRVVERVLSRKLALDRLLAITFTENAAAEMKNRLAEAFEERGQEQLRRGLESAYISTIHGFCSRLLHENAIDAAVDPHFQVLDLDAGLEKEKTLKAIFEEWDGREPERFFQFVHHFKGKNYAELLEELYDTVRRMGCDPEDRSQLLRPPKTLPAAIEEARAAMRELAPNVRTRLADQLAEVEACLQRSADAGDPRDVVRESGAAQSALYKRQGVTALREALAGVRAAAIEALAASHRETVASLLAELHRRYAARKAALAALDFEDLEHLALETLRRSPALLERIRGRFDEILVDEYQDTSPIQSDIIQLLAEGRRLFVVGDLAQSIYGFRGAEPRAFQELREKAVPPDGQIDLRQDFRSRPEILAAVNRHFEERLRHTGTPFTPLAQGSKFGDKAPPSVELLLVERAESEDLEQTRGREAALLAQRMRALIKPDDESRRLRITNPKVEEQRRREEPPRGPELDYRDVAMLFRSTTDIKIYERALDEAGIPYFSQTGRGFYQAREVRDVMAFLRVLDNSRNEVAMAAVLRSPMFGISDDALFLLADHAHQGEGRVLSDVLAQGDPIPGIEGEDAERLARFTDIWEGLCERRPWLSLAELVREVVRVTGYDLALLLQPNGRRKVANLHKLAEVAAVLEKAGGETSLNDLISSLDRLHFEEIREGEAQLDAQSENAVRMMTMHGAKGLEFPLVVLPDLGRGTRSDRDFLDFLPEYGIGVQFNLAGLLEDPAVEKTQTLKVIRQGLDRRDEAERLRVLFVAFTRAQEHLLLSGCVKQAKGAYKPEKALAEVCESFGIRIPVPLTPEWSRQRIEAEPAAFSLQWKATDEAARPTDIGALPIARLHRMALEQGLSLNLPVESRIEQEMNAVVDMALRAMPKADSSDYLAAATDVMEFQACPRRYYLGRYLGFEPPEAYPEWDDGTGEETVADGEEPAVPRSELGSLAHKVLAAPAGAHILLPEGIREEVRGLVETFRQSEYGKRTESGNVRRELQILAKIGDRFLRGDIDLLLFEDGRPVLLLDYKTNKITAGQVAEYAAHYRPQMLLYARLVEAAFGSLPREAVLFFLVPGVAHRVELTAAVLTGTDALLERFFRAQAELSFPENVSEHCHRCQFNGTLCLAPLGQ
jgi:ATP-dependent exoDNAse (exonuclease V) beta subunit